MNLYELAYHPFAFMGPLAIQKCRIDSYWAGHPDISTEEQFKLLYNRDYRVDEHTDENEYRMHLLFIYWATLSDVPD